MAEYKTLVKKIPVSPDKKTKQKDYLKKGRLPIVDQGQSLVGGYTDDADMAVKCELPVIVFGDHTRAVKYITFPFGAGADGIKVLQPKENILPLFLYYATQYIVAKMPNRGYARHYQYVEKEDLPVPPLPEQERIVARIEELFSQLDAGVETLKKTKAQLAVYRQAVLKEAFEGRLTQAFREENGLPDWKTISITQAIVQRKNALKAGPFGSALKKECYVPSGYKVYGQEQVIANNENIGNYYIDEEKYQELISCAIAPHDILISLVGTVGKVLVLSDNCLPGIINPRLIKVTLDEKIMMPYFFKYYFESAYLKSLYKKKAHGATMDVLNMGMIKELPFPLCDIQEQGQVIKEIESRLSVCDSIEQTVDTALQQAEAMRQSILKQAFKGEL